MTTNDDEEVVQHDDLWGIVDHIVAKATASVEDSPDARLIDLRLKRFKRLNAADRLFVRQRATGRPIMKTHRVEVSETDGTVHVVRI